MSELLDAFSLRSQAGIRPTFPSEDHGLQLEDSRRINGKVFLIL